MMICPLQITARIINLGGRPMVSLYRLLWCSHPELKRNHLRTEVAAVKLKIKKSGGGGSTFNSIWQPTEILPITLVSSMHLLRAWNVLDPGLSSVTEK